MPEMVQNMSLGAAKLWEAEINTTPKRAHLKKCNLRTISNANKIYYIQIIDICRRYTDKNISTTTCSKMRQPASERQLHSIRP